MTTVIFLGALSVIASLAYGLYFVHQETSGLRTMCKAVAVSALAFVSILSNAPVALTCALVLGSIGDVFLSRDGERNFLCGLVAFLLGHLAYVGLLSGVSVPFQEATLNPWRLGGGLLLVATAAIVVWRLLPHLGAMQLPVIVYVAVSLALGVAALSLPMTWPLNLALLGALLFITSDAILGFELFVFKDAGRSRRFPATLLWVLYWGGQTLILLAFVNWM